jgi:hypothetical protein
MSQSPADTTTTVSGINKAPQTLCLRGPHTYRTLKFIVGSFKLEVFLQTEEFWNLL